MGAQTDFLSERTRQVSRKRLIWKQFMNGSLEDRPEAYGLASPLEHLDENDPPCLIICGEMDDESTRAEEFRDRMNRLNIPSALKVITGAPHGFLRNQVWFDQMIEAADFHFKRVLKQS
jgi:dipeptidyl aminopeptidase/acylaminoacyl peptidase